MTKTIFDHVPKTAGTSVKEALAAAIGERGELPGVSYPHHVLIASAGMRRFLGSHIWFFPGDRLAPEWYYCTLLRDPVDRFLSQYYFHRAHREQVLAGSMTDPVVIAAVNQELEDYLADKSPDVLRSYVNFQATHFARRLCDDPATLSDAALLETAISSLEEYDLVGVVSDTQGFIDTYCQDLGLPRQTLPTLNVTQNRKRERDISAELTNHIKVSNRVDHALCEWAAQRFQEQRHQISSFFTLSERRGETQRGRPQRHQQAIQAKQATQATQAAANFGTREIELLSASCLGQHSRSSSVSAGEVVSVQLSCHAFIDEEDLTIGIGVRDAPRQYRVRH